MIDHTIETCHRTSSFLHFFDIHFLDLKKAHLHGCNVAIEARIATKIALLCTDEILIPAASFFENRICRNIILELRSLFGLGLIWLVGAASNIEEFVYRKMEQYDKKSIQYQAYRKILLKDLPPFRTRHRSATNDIKTDWLIQVEDNNTISQIAEGTGYTLPNDFEKRWEHVPVEIEKKAFVVPYVAPLLLKGDLHPTILNRLYYIINKSYFSSYVNEFRSRTVGDLIFLESPHKVPSYGPQIPFRKLRDRARSFGLLNNIVTCTDNRILTIKNDEKWLKCLDLTVNQQLDDDQHLIFKLEKKKGRTMDMLRSFIVHGHDSEAKLELKDYLQNTLNLPEPIILHQKPSLGRTVIEKFEEVTKETDVSFIMLTPDDIGGTPNGEHRERARQNVIFELGYFVGRFGRKSGRVILLHKGELEIPSDLVGVIYIDISNGIDAAGEQIRKELSELSRIT